MHLELNFTYNCYDEVIFVLHHMLDPGRQAPHPEPNCYNKEDHQTVIKIPGAFDVRVNKVDEDNVLIIQSFI